VNNLIHSAVKIRIQDIAFAYFLLIYLPIQIKCGSGCVRKYGDVCEEAC